MMAQSAAQNAALADKVAELAKKVNKIDEEE